MYYLATRGAFQYTQNATNELGTSGGREIPNSLSCAEADRSHSIVAPAPRSESPRFCVPTLFSVGQSHFPAPLDSLTNLGKTDAYRRPPQNGCIFLFSSAGPSFCLPVPARMLAGHPPTESNGRCGKANAVPLPQPVTPFSKQPVHHERCPAPPGPRSERQHRAASVLRGLIDAATELSACQVERKIPNLARIERPVGRGEGEAIPGALATKRVRSAPKMRAIEPSAGERKPKMANEPSDATPCLPSRKHAGSKKAACVCFWTGGGYQAASGYNSAGPGGRWRSGLVKSCRARSSQETDRS